MNSIGEQYQVLREEKGLSVEEVYQKTRIHPSVIEAIENNTIQDRFSTIYVKGFLKKYAQFLGLDCEAILKDYEVNMPAKPLPQLLMTKPQSYAHNYKRLPLVISGVIVGIIFMVTMINYFQRVPMGKIEEIMPAREQTALINLNVGKGATLVPKGEKLRLTVIANREVWMRVMGDGEIVYEGVLKKDSRENWVAEEDFRLWVGKAEGLKFILNGQELASPGKGVIRNISITREGLKIK